MCTYHRKADIRNRYARVMERILRQASNARRQSETRRLLAWTACATRALKWQEIQGAVSIDFDLGEVDYDRRQLVSSAKHLCGALIEELSNGDIVFIHSTVES